MLKNSEKNQHSCQNWWKTAKFCSEWAWASSAGSIGSPNAPHRQDKVALIVTKFGGTIVLIIKFMSQVPVSITDRNRSGVRPPTHPHTGLSNHVKAIRLNKGPNHSVIFQKISAVPFRLITGYRFVYFFTITRGRPSTVCQWRCCHETGSCCSSSVHCHIYPKLHMIDNTPDLKTSKLSFCNSPTLKRSQHRWKLCWKIRVYLQFSCLYPRIQSYNQV